MDYSTLGGGEGTSVEEKSGRLLGWVDSEGTLIAVRKKTCIIVN